MKLSPALIFYKNIQYLTLTGLLSLIFFQVDAYALPPVQGKISAEIPPEVAEGLLKGQVQELIVEFDGSAIENEVSALKASARLKKDDAPILALRETRYRNLKQLALRNLPPQESETLLDYSHLPMRFMRIRSKRALDALVQNSRVVAIFKNTTLYPVLAQSLPLINQPAVAAAGETGSGSTTVVVDTGVNYTLADFGSCTAPGVPASCKINFYQNIADTSTVLDSSGHGTNVSGIVVGVASGSRVAMVNVFGASASTTSSLVISAINWAIANQAVFNITAINLSVGDGVLNTTPCNNSKTNAYVTPVSNAQAAGIITVASSGNESYTTGISGPACTPGAVSVGAVYDANVGGLQYANCTDLATATDMVACFSNSAGFLTLLAPGALISAAGSTYAGTSQAAPHVAGAIAVLSSIYPAETVSQIIHRLTANGKPVTDPRNSITTPRLNLLAAAAPANDAFANRIALVGNIGSTTGSNVLSTKETGEPLHASNAGGKSVWWKWLAPASGQVILDTHGSSFDTLLGVYTGNSVTNLIAVSTNDNDGSQNNNSGLVFQALANTEYEIAVDGFNAASGKIALNWNLNTTAKADITVGINGNVIPGGGTLVYTITVTNNGPQIAGNTTLTVNLAANLSLLSAPGCSITGAVLNCIIGNLGSVASTQITVTVSPATTGTFVTTISATSDLPDPNLLNNSALSTITIIAPTVNDNDIPMLPPWAMVLMTLLLAVLGGSLSSSSLCLPGRR